MRVVFAEAIRLLERQEPFVLATVVATSGSCPQRPGAKILVRQDGSLVGTVGGGCVEGDVWYLAKELLRNHGNQPLYREYVLNEAMMMRDGLICGGTMYLFIEPVLPGTDGQLAAMAREICQTYDGGTQVALASVTKPGLNAVRLGAKLLIRQDRTTCGTLGSEVLETMAIAALDRLTQEQGTCYLKAPDGSELFVENFSKTPLLILLGGGHIGKALAQIGLLLGFCVYVVDERPEFASRERFPEAAAAVVDDFANWPAKIPLSDNTFVVVATRGHKFDDIALETALRIKPRYVGLLGSRRKSAMIYQSLHQKGFSIEEIRQVHTPVGLNIGAISPEEIAVSIMAEIVMCRRGGTGAPMTDDRLLEQLTTEFAPKSS